MSTLISLALTLAAPTAGDQPPPAPPPAKPDKPKLRCKTYPETGSLIAQRRVCKTEMQWRDEDQDIQSLHNQSLCAGPSCTGSPGG